MAYKETIIIVIFYILDIVVLTIEIVSAIDIVLITEIVSAKDTLITFESIVVILIVKFVLAKVLFIVSIIERN